MSRSIFDEVDDLFFDFDASKAKRRVRSAEDDVAALREDVHALEQQLVNEVQRTQKMMAVIVEALVGSGAVKRDAILDKLREARAGRGRPLAAALVSTATTENVSTCDGCGANVKPSNSYLRDDRRLCATCYDAE